MVGRWYSQTDLCSTRIRQRPEWQTHVACEVGIQKPKGHTSSTWKTQIQWHHVSTTILLWKSMWMDIWWYEGIESCMPGENNFIWLAWVSAFTYLHIGNGGCVQRSCLMVIFITTFFQGLLSPARRSSSRLQPSTTLPENFGTGAATCLLDR